MKRKEFAELIKVSRNTLNNWEKNKPELIKIINMGIMCKEEINNIEIFINRIKKIKDKETKKLILK